MVETWRDSWFEEGSRLIYIVPEKFVNRILPFSINPSPVQVMRVFVGRMELVTPATERAVERAFALHDQTTLAKYGRFLELILQTMLAKDASHARAREYNQYLGRVYDSLLAQAQARN